MSFAALLHFGHLSRLSGYALAGVTTLVGFSGVQAAQTNFCWCVGALLRSGNIYFTGHRLSVHSPEIQRWNFCELLELVSCFLLFHWHATFQALCGSCASVKQETYVCWGFAVLLWAVVTSQIPCQCLRGSPIKLGLPLASEILTACCSTNSILRYL